MTRKTSALLAVMAICSLYVFAIQSINNPYLGSRNPNGIWYPIGGVAWIVGVPAAVAVVVGLIGGAIKTGGFKPTFYWSYIILLPVFTFVAYLGSTAAL